MITIYQMWKQFLTE